MVLGKKLYGMVDSDKQMELHLNNVNNEWITAFNLKLAHELLRVERVGRYNMIENRDSVLRRLAEEEVELKSWWTKMVRFARMVSVRKEVIEKW